MMIAIHEALTQDAIDYERAHIDTQAREAIQAEIERENERAKRRARRKQYKRFKYAN